MPKSTGGTRRATILGAGFRSLQAVCVRLPGSMKCVKAGEQQYQARSAFLLERGCLDAAALDGWRAAPAAADERLAGLQLITAG